MQHKACVLHVLSIRLVRKQDMCAILLEVVDKSKLKITSLKHGVHSKALQIRLQTLLCRLSRDATGQDENHQVTNKFAM